MRWVLTGGTGFIGRALLGALEARNDDVVVLSRRSAATRGRVRTVTWTPEERGAWMREIDGANVVCHLAGEPIAEGRWTDERLKKIRASRVLSTDLIGRAIAESAKKPGVLVSGSAVGIYGMRKDDALLDENSPLGTDVLADICKAWEDAAAPARDAGVRVVHARTGIVLGKGEGILGKMVPAFRAFVGGPLGDGKQWVSFIHVDDEVRALVHCAETSTMAGAVNLTAPNPVTMNELSAALARTLHRPNFFRVPKIAAAVALGKMADAALTGQRVLPRKLTESGFEFRFPVIDAALQDLLK